MHGYFTRQEECRAGSDPVFHELSHGESFLEALPGARILEIGPWGMREAVWKDLELVQHWRRYLDAPMRYLRHVLDET